MYEPYPLSKFKQLAKIKTLLSECERGTVQADPDQDDGVTAAKKPRLEPLLGEHKYSLKYLVSVLEQDLEAAEKTILWQHLNCQTAGSLSMTACLNIVRSLNSDSQLSHNLKEQQNSFLAPIISNTIIYFKSDPGMLMEEISKLSSKQPNLLVLILSRLVVDEDLFHSVFSVLDTADLEAGQIDELFRLCMVSVPVTSTTTLTLVEDFLSRWPGLVENSVVMSLLVENCYKNSSPEQNKCLRFAKFYRKILTSLPGNNEQAVHFLRQIIEKNETFLKNRMVKELSERFPHLTEGDSKTTNEEEN